MGKRAFVGVMFRCCHIYGRAYLNREASAYEARCPRCAQSIQIRVSPQGAKSRFFSVG